MAGLVMVAQLMCSSLQGSAGPVCAGGVTDDRSVCDLTRTGLPGATRCSLATHVWRTRCWSVLVRVIYLAECDECDLSPLLGYVPLRDRGCVWKLRNEMGERAW
ncbi:unnamed protein product [Tetraodon nigroviridis]|uniref:(spotted green pufferfish) hypothetical protein n=1 Tax=Tetraodon nigroviridis TaxID=99883 RepID=Q4RYX9_TETNG|nr:unnamed protein product [Tetraodon nigroviridis]